MILAFKRPHNLATKLIDLLSGRDGFCHVELVFSDGMSFSSTSLDGKPDGTRFKRIGYSHPEWWAFVDLPVAVNEARVRAHAEDLAAGNKGYDYLGVARFVLPWMPEHKSKYFCSEVVVTVLQTGGMLLEEKPWKVSPNRLAKLCGVVA